IDMYSETNRRVENLSDYLSEIDKILTNSAKKALSVKLKERQKKHKVLDEGITNCFDNREKIKVIDLEDNSIDAVVEVPNCSWDDIGGLENIKRELQEGFFSMVLLDVVSPFLLRLLQSTVEPTSSASKDQNCLQCGLVRVKPMFVKYCDKARGSAPCILLFDELDSIATQVMRSLIRFWIKSIYIEEKFVSSVLILDHAKLRIDLLDHLESVLANEPVTVKRGHIRDLRSSSVTKPAQSVMAHQSEGVSI
ncbi:hypothetical protein Tco_0617735, partial [Tanacetum coccineum]